MKWMERPMPDIVGTSRRHFCVNYIHIAIINKILVACVTYFVYVWMQQVPPKKNWFLIHNPLTVNKQPHW